MLVSKKTCTTIGRDVYNYDIEFRGQLEMIFWFIILTALSLASGILLRYGAAVILSLAISIVYFFFTGEDALSSAIITAVLLFVIMQVAYAIGVLLSSLLPEHLLPARWDITGHRSRSTQKRNGTSG